MTNETHYDKEFYVVPQTWKRYDEWIMYVIIAKGNDWPDPAYFIARWLGENGMPNPENMEEHSIHEWMQRCINVYKSFHKYH